MDSRETVYHYCEVTPGALSTLTYWGNSRLSRLIDLVLGQTLGDRYVLLSELGKGGMGQVYLARDPVLGREVALKVNLVAEVVQPGGVFSLVREGRLAAMASHPSIATVFDTGVHAGQPYTIYEYIEGNDLRTVMQKRSPHWPVEDVSEILNPLAAALDYAHAEGVVHSDLKPQNICLTSGGKPKILDFGVARLLNEATSDHKFRGTPAYASPEQASCRTLDGRSDQYSLALIVYELLCGRLPFQEETTIARMLTAHQSAKPPSVSVFRHDLPEKLVAVVMRALEKDPSSRFATCREFFAAFQDAISKKETGHAFERHTEIHITETQTESLVAKVLAESLEALGYRAWYYQRDALPGIPLKRQVAESMQSTRAIILLISRNALNAPVFSEEVAAANRLDTPILPILVDMSLEEFESHPPDWRPTLGSAAIVEYSRSRLESVVSRLGRSLELLSIFPGNPPPKVTSPKKAVANQTWVTDSNQIDNRDLQRVVFRNQIINDFLSKPNKFFLSATKGLGKTLLLKYKRHLLTSDLGTEKVAHLIPSGQPYLDFMSELKSLSRNYESQLSELSFCKRLWSTALRISILSHHSKAISEDQDFEIKAFPQRIQRWLHGKPVEPTVVFKELTNLQVSEVNRLIDGTESFLDECIRNIHASTMVFIDKVDQAIRHASRMAWIHIQAGLIEAAWDLMSANSHIKIFASIRQEAFANFQSDIKANLLGATAALRYTDEEMKGLMDQLTACYEGFDGYQAFVGINVIKHPSRPAPEDSFEFLKRFTFGRPRDFVAIAAELSAAHNSLDERRYCDLIRQTSAVGLMPSLFDESRAFLDCLFNREQQVSFFGLLNTNIISRESAIAISRRFNGLPVDQSVEFDEESPSIYHPFRDLFLTGLLGYVKRTDQDLEFQRFRQPDDSLSVSTSDLPFSSYYFIHPALSEFIQRALPSSQYRIVQQILVGENAPWNSFDAIILQIELALAEIENLHIRSRVQEMLAEVKVVKLTTRGRVGRAVVESKQYWQDFQLDLTNLGYEDIVLWFEELLDA